MEKKQKLFENLTSLYSIYQSKLYLYHKLYAIELKDGKKSENYKKHLYFLTIEQEIENKDLKKMSLERNYDNLEMFLKYFRYKGQDFATRMNINNQLHDIVNDSIVTNYFSNNFNLTNNQIDDYIENDIIEVSRSLHLSSTGRLKISRYKQEYNLGIICYKDFVNNFLYYIEKRFNDNIYYLDLLMLKYQILYSHNFLEQRYLLNDNNIEMNIFKDEYENIIRNGFDSDYKDNFKNEYGLEMISYAIVNLLNIGDYEYLDKENILEVIIYEAILNSGFSLLNNEGLEKFKEKILNIISKNINIEVKNNLSLSTVEATFKNNYKKLKKSY